MIVFQKIDPALQETGNSLLQYLMPIFTHKTSFRLGICIQSSCPEFLLPLLFSICLLNPTSVWAQSSDYHHLYMSHGNRLLKEFVVKLSNHESRTLLKSILKDDIVISKHQNQGFSEQKNEQKTTYNYILSMIEGNGIERNYTVRVTHKENSFIISNGFLKIQLEPMAFQYSSDIVNNWVSPFLDKERKSIALIKTRLADRFGAYRSSIKRGHKHAGVDLKGDWDEAVFPVARGTVIFKSHWPHKSTLVLRHQLNKESAIYSKYTHLKNLSVAVGDQVDENTKLGQLFDKELFQSSGFNYNHFHLEIRKNYQDKGRASSYSMTMQALKQHCYDPMEFLSKNFQ